MGGIKHGYPQRVEVDGSLDLEYPPLSSMAVILRQMTDRFDSSTVIFMAFESDSQNLFSTHFQALPAYMERVQEDGVRLTEEELEERRQELLAKAEIQVSQSFCSKTIKNNFRRAKQKNSTTQMLEKFYLYSKSVSEKIKN